MSNLPHTPTPTPYSPLPIPQPRRYKMKNKQCLLWIAITLTLTLTLSACTNFFFPEMKSKGGDETKPYTIEIDIRGAQQGDTVTADPVSGHEEDEITLHYIVADITIYNLLDFSGVDEAIAGVISAGSGTRTYTINPSDAIDGLITIIANFEHTNLTPDPIAFTDTRGHIAITYGDSFTNAITDAHEGTGDITYTSSNTDVADVNDDGSIIIYKTGTTTITAEKEEDTEFAHAVRAYTLTINQKPVTITGITANDKIYNGEKGTTFNNDNAEIEGKLDNDTVTINYDNAKADFVDANVGNNKTVQFTGFALAGADAGNYTLSSQPADVTANIKPAPIEYTIEIDIQGAQQVDSVTADPVSGYEGEEITLHYTVADITIYNLLDFSGVEEAIAGVTVAGSGTRTYTINPSDSIDGLITIIANFEHTNLTPDPITFTNTSGHIFITYGDSFTNAITDAHEGTGDITYTSSNLDVAGVNEDGSIIIYKTGTTTITAEKEEDAEFAHAVRAYTLTINPKPVTITGITANDKVYNGEKGTTFNSGSAEIEGKLDNDTVTINYSNAKADFVDAAVGNNKTVQFTGFALAGADAANYTLSSQPANVNANITPATLSGNIVIKHNNSEIATAIIGQQLNADYSGSESVTYHWKRNGTDIATGLNFTPTETGSYTVTVSNANYNPKTSGAVTVTLPAGEFTITFDPIADKVQPIDEDIILSRSGETEVEITLADQYDEVEWYITGTTINKTGGNFTLRADDFTIYGNGLFILTLEVRKGTKWYNTTVTFELED